MILLSNVQAERPVKQVPYWRVAPMKHIIIKMRRISFLHETFLCVFQFAFAQYIYFYIVQLKVTTFLFLLIVYSISISYFYCLLFLFCCF